VRGTKNLRTIEDELNAGMDAERTFSEARAHHKKLAKEVLADFMQVFMGIATRYQPLAKDGTPNPGYDEDKFERWSMTRPSEIRRQVARIASADDCQPSPPCATTSTRSAGVIP